jgi:DUF4097 and DUF4098 domain-containing protein YvlB
MTTLAQPAPPAYRTPPAVRRALLVVAGLIALALVALGTFNLLDLAARHKTTQSASYEHVRTLVVDDASDIRLTNAPPGTPLQVITRLTEGFASPKHSAERTADGGLRLWSSCPVFGGQCEVNYEIRVPSGTLVRAKSSGGDIAAQDLVSNRPLDLRSSAGDVSAVDTSAPAIQLSSSAGDVAARGLRAARVEAESSAGDVHVSLGERAPDRLLADSSGGDVDVIVPDAVYRLDATSSGGDVDAADVRTDPGSSHAITAHSSAGDVHVAARR